MKKLTPMDPHSADNDIAQLFASQSIRAPEELKNSILEQAQLQIAEQEPKASYTSWTRGFGTRGFGIAATLLVAALIAPMLLQEPESSLATDESDSMFENEASAPIVHDITSSRKMANQSAFNPDTSQPHRESAEKWMNEIKILIANGDEQKARDEYRLFEQQHPAQAEDFNPDFNRRPIDDNLPTDGTDRQ